jgi:hypothetical protein
VPPRPPVRSSRLRTGVSSAALLAVLALTGCTDQPEEANNNGPQPDADVPSGIVRTPAPVESAPLTVPLPGETNSPNVEGETASPVASTNPSGL